MLHAKKEAMDARTGPPRRLSAHSGSHIKLFFDGAFVWARRVLKRQKRRFPARAVKAEHPALWTTFSELDADHSGALDKVVRPAGACESTRLRRCPCPSVPVGRRRPRPQPAV
jgi:hypothetical protein